MQGRRQKPIRPSDEAPTARSKLQVDGSEEAFSEVAQHETSNSHGLDRESNVIIRKSAGKSADMVQ